MAPLKLEELAREACHCRYCFGRSDFGVVASKIAIAQPRWIGPNYWETSKKILILMLNPGSGESRTDGADEQMYQDLLAFNANEDVSLDGIFEKQKADMRKWGHGRFWKYFVDGLHLKFDDIAFANIAWCATQGNRYPTPMLSKCFESFTSRLIVLLSPNIILLCGGATQRFSRQIKSLLPNAHLISAMHFAHREGRVTEETELQRIRDILITAARTQ